MSYDLFFYKRKNAATTSGVIADYLNRRLHHEHEFANQWLYENENTGVYFTINRDRNLIEDEGDHGSLFQYTGLSFNLNYLRPSFSIADRVRH